MKELQIIAWFVVACCGAMAQQRAVVGLYIGRGMFASESYYTLTEYGKERCSITLSSTPEGIEWRLERPGDDIISISNRITKKLSYMKICGKAGSELRVAGSIELRYVSIMGNFLGIQTLKVDEGVPRLCFKKVKNGWAYLSGSGYITQVCQGLGCNPEPRRREIGRSRTVESCLEAVDSPDEIVREGCARDLGRMAAQADRTRVTAALSRLLSDPVPDVRGGAAEGLGLLVSLEAVEKLKAALASESDSLVKQRISEGLAYAAGADLLGGASATGLGTDEALRLFVSGGTPWVADLISSRCTDKTQLAARLGELLKSPAAQERVSAVRLTAAVAGKAAVEILEDVAAHDEDATVKAAANRVLESLREK